MLDKTHSVLQSLMEGNSNDEERSSGNLDALHGSLTSNLSRSERQAVQHDPTSSWQLYQGADAQDTRLNHAYGIPLGLSFFWLTPGFP